MYRDAIAEMAEQVKRAHDSAAPLSIIGGGSKYFFGRNARILDTCGPLSTAAVSGIVDYDPTELVVTAGAGTPLKELEAALDEQGQMLAFEPPHFGAAATVGGTVACGVSGPRRPYAGAVRDFVLGIKCINGKGEILNFGGRVMKNVAGFDVSRLMVGAMGTLGVLLEISLKVMPKPELELTLVSRSDAEQAITRMNELAARPVPLSGAAYQDGLLYVRCSGVGAAVERAAASLSGDPLTDGERFWHDLKEHRLAFFGDDRPLWRVIVPPATRMTGASADWLVDWGGGQRWFKSGKPAAEIRADANAHGGYAALFRGGAGDGEVFDALTLPMMGIHQRLKRSFDPRGVLNPGRMYSFL